MVIDMVVDVRPEADGTWAVVLTPAITALRTKHRGGLASLPTVQAEVRGMLEALVYGGFSVTTTWTLDGAPAAWLAHPLHDTPTAPDPAAPDPAAPDPAAPDPARHAGPGSTGEGRR